MSKKRSAPKPAKSPATAADGTSNKVIKAKTRRSGLGCSIAGVGLLVVLLASVILATPWLLAVLANGVGVPAPLSAGAAHGLLVEQQSQAIAQLNSYGWVDKAAGVAHVPIERAITLLAASNLPVGIAAAAPVNTDPATVTEDAGDLTNVNFTDNILPIFQDYCSECHGDDAPEEGLVLTSYKDVMAGSFYGKVIKPGDPGGSYLVEMVSTGKMPKKGAKLTTAEIDTIIAWINAGAPEHGSATATSAAISETVPASGTVAISGTVATTATVATVAVTSETVSFANDVLPIFQDRCSECHSGDAPEEGLVLTSYKDVMAGSFYGSVIKPNDVAGSYLFEMVSSGKMPKKGADLTKAQIDTIIAWIEAGAPDN